MNPSDLTGMLGTVLHQYPDGILVLDCFHRIVLINALVLKFFDAAGVNLEQGSLFPHLVDPELKSEIHLLRVLDLSPLILGMTAARINHDGQQLLVVAIKDITEEIRLREELKCEALNDDLTGLYNRKGFCSLAEHQLIVAEREETSVSLFYFDLDRLKSINDTFGHSEGDNAIRAFSELLKQTFRKADILARLGGDEFAVLVVSHQRSAADCALLRLFGKIAQLNEDSKMQYVISVSHGCASYDRFLPSTLSELIASADFDMYQNKRSRKVLQFVAIDSIGQVPKAS